MFNNLFKFVLYLSIKLNPKEKFKYVEPDGDRILYNCATALPLNHKKAKNN